MVHLHFRLAIVACGGLLLEVAGVALRRSNHVADSAPVKEHSFTGAREPSQEQAKTVQQEQSSTDKKEGSEVTRSCLSGKRIVFIGPSTSKADYLALTFFAEYGRWPDQDEIMYGGVPGKSGPNPLYGPILEYGPVGGHEKPAEVYPCKVGTSEGYLWYSNSILNNHELCDCYKNDRLGNFQIADIYNQTENRIYVNGDTMIAYFQWFGDTVKPRGSVNLSPLTYLPVHLDPPKAVDQQCPVGQFKGSWDWTIPVEHFIANFVRNLKPTHLIVDAAYWPINPHNLPLWDEISTAGANAVVESKGTAFWRTVPLRNDYPIPVPSNSVGLGPFHTKGWKIFDASGVVSHFRGNKKDDDVFFDTVHLKPFQECQLMSNFLQTHVCPVR